MEYKSCYHISHGVSIEENIIRNCCITTPTNYDTPILLRNYNHDDIEWEKIFEEKKALKEQQKISELDKCKGCHSLEIKEWDDEHYITHMNFHHWKTCNCKCIYCDLRQHKYPPYKSIFKSIKKLVNSSYYRKGGEITFQGGEPTILEEFEELVDLFIQQNTKLRVHSSGIKFSEKLAQAIEMGLATAVISIDSGTEKTYQKVKNVPCFDKICTNIEKYSQKLNEKNKNNLKIKYIIIPGYNDNIDEIDKFFEIVKKNKINNVIVDIECKYTQKHIKKIPSHIYTLMDYIKKECNDANIIFEKYDSAIYIESHRKNKKPQTFINNKFLTRIMTHLGRFLNSNKNIKYYS